jgi:hypothetical protein
LLIDLIFFILAEDYIIFYLDNRFFFIQTFIGILYFIAHLVRSFVFGSICYFMLHLNLLFVLYCLFFQFVDSFGVNRCFYGDLLLSICNWVSCWASVRGYSRIFLFGNFGLMAPLAFFTMAFGELLSYWNFDLAIA